MYVCMYECMYVFMYVCMYVRMYVCDCIFIQGGGRANPKVLAQETVFLLSIGR